MWQNSKFHNNFLTFPEVSHIMSFDMRNGDEMLSSASLSDEALCRLAQQGDGAAAEDLVKRYTRSGENLCAPLFSGGCGCRGLDAGGYAGTDESNARI